MKTKIILALLSGLTNFAMGADLPVGNFRGEVLKGPRRGDMCTLSIKIVADDAIEAEIDTWKMPGKLGRYFTLTSDRNGYSAIGSEMRYHAESGYVVEKRAKEKLTVSIDQESPISMTASFSVNEMDGWLVCGNLSNSAY